MVKKIQILILMVSAAQIAGSDKIKSEIEVAPKNNKGVKIWLKT